MEECMVDNVLWLVIRLCNNILNILQIENAFDTSDLSSVTAYCILL